MIFMWPLLLTEAMLMAIAQGDLHYSYTRAFIPVFVQLGILLIGATIAFIMLSHEAVKKFRHAL